MKAWIICASSLSILFILMWKIALFVRSNAALCLLDFTWQQIIKLRSSLCLYFINKFLRSIPMLIILFLTSTNCRSTQSVSAVETPINPLLLTYLVMAIISKVQTPPSLQGTWVLTINYVKNGKWVSKRIIITVIFVHCDHNCNLP
jgi:hypothetical protein